MCGYNNINTEECSEIWTFRALKMVLDGKQLQQQKVVDLLGWLLHAHVCVSPISTNSQF